MANRRVPLARGGEELAALLSQGPVTKADACEALGFTGAQFTRALAYIRDVLAAANQEPVAFDPGTWEYSFAGENGEAAAYATYRQRIALKQLNRLRSGTVAPAMDKFATAGDVHAMRYLRYLDGAIAELTEQIALVGVNGQPA